MNPTETIKNLVSAPLQGHVFDEEPHPLGEVVSVEEVPIIGKRIKIRIQDRRSDLVREATILAAFIDYMPIAMEIEEMNDAG